MAEEDPCGLSHHFPDYSRYLIEQLSVQKYYGAFCDVIVRVDDVEFRLHKCVLAAASSKLQSMLYNMRQECGNVLAIEEITLNGFKVLMDFMYSGVLKVDSAYMQDVLAAAQYLDIREVEKTCLEIMSQMEPPIIGNAEQHLRAMAFASSGGLDIQPPPLPPQPLEQSHISVQPVADSQPLTPVQHVTQMLTNSPSTLPSSPAPINTDSPMAVGITQQMESSQPVNSTVPVSQLQTQTFSTPGGGISVDTTYIEDYLKLIESLQGESAVQSAIHAKVVQAQNERPEASSFMSNGLQSRLDSEPTNPQMITIAAPTNYTQSSPQSSSLKFHSSQKSTRPVTTSPHSSGTQIRSVAPCNLYSADDVRRTILSVLSQEKFGEGDDDANTKQSCSVYDRESVPLTALLNIDPMYQSENRTICGTEQVDEQASVMNSSVSDNSDNEVAEHTIQNESSDNKDSIIPIRLLEPNTVSCRATAEYDGSTGQAKQKRKIKTPVRVDRKTIIDVTCSDTEGQANDTKLVSIKKKKKVKKTKGLQGDKKTPNNVAFISEDMIKNKPLKKRLRMAMKKRNICIKCGREFYKQESLDKHMELHNLNQMHSCHVCSQKFTRPCELTRHLRTHSADVFKCLHCEAEYAEPTAYRQHMVTVHRETKAFICQFPGCEFRSAKLSNVEKHSVIHSDVKTFQCHQCGRKFAQSNGLRSHVRSCMEQRSYLCDICGAKFNHLQSMKNHRRLHTGEKPHQCPDCGAKFTDHRNFKRHMRIHENIFPYPCTFCNKKFRHSNSLKAHVQSHLKHITADDVNLDIKTTVSQ